MPKKITDKDWEEAEEHLHEVEQRYLDKMGLPGSTSAFFMSMILPEIRGAWNKGIRNRALYNKIMAL